MNLDQAKLKVSKYLKDTYGDWIKLQMSHIVTFEALKDSFIEEVSGYYRESMEMEEAVDSAKADWDSLGISKTKVPSRRLRPAKFTPSVKQPFTVVFMSEDDEVSIEVVKERNADMAKVEAIRQFIAHDTDGDWDTAWKIVCVVPGDHEKNIVIIGATVASEADDAGIV